MTQDATTSRASAPSRPNQIELNIGGMTCASCANRIERKLNKVDGVTAAVNYATEKAKVSYAGDLTAEDLVAIVEATGYTATLPAPPARDDATTRGASDVEHVEAARWWQRLSVSAVLTLPVLLLAMIPALQFDNWQWISLTLASPVVVWAPIRSTRPRWSTPGTAPPPWTP